MANQAQAIATHNNGEPHTGIDSPNRNDQLMIPSSARHDANATHGNIRADLTWDNNLGNDAQNWANHLASIDDLEHSSNESRPNEGENISSYSGTFATSDLNVGATQWANEVSKYNGEKIGEGDFEQWGHYTQVRSPPSPTQSPYSEGSGEEMERLRCSVCSCV